MLTTVVDKTMTSNLFSRFLPANNGRSIYEELNAPDEGFGPDLEDRAGLALDEENLRFRDEDLGSVDSRMTSESAAFLPAQRHSNRRGAERRNETQGDHSKLLPQSPRLIGDDGDDDVPQSLLIGGDEMPGPSFPTQPRNQSTQNPTRQPPIPGPSNSRTQAHWDAAQAQQRLHQDLPPESPILAHPRAGVLTGSARDKAMWRWTNVTNIDKFIAQVYDYYLGGGIWCILLERVVGLA